MSKKSVSNVGKVYNQYTDEFRRDAVAMIESEGLTTAEVGRRLGVNAMRWYSLEGQVILLF